MAAPQSRRSKISLGIPGLDVILDGGVLNRAVYIVQGRPGTGKTIFANQVAFHHARAGGRVLYVTLLAETHERMFWNLEALSFFDASLIPDRITYLSGLGALDRGGYKDLVTMLRREAQAQKASIIIIDGIAASREEAAVDATRRFLHEMQIAVTLLESTALIIMSAPTNSEAVTEHTMVDGVFELHDNRIVRRAEREIDIQKLRGSASVRGTHAFRIADDGITVFPRIEAVFADPPPQDPRPIARASTGIAGLDEALHGGLPSLSSTALFGPTGVGKTTMGLHFLDAAAPGERALHFGFYEPPPRLLHKAHALGLGLGRKHEEGTLRIVWTPPTERVLDELGHKLLDAVRAHRATRLFVDGIDGFLRQSANPERTAPVFVALTHQLRLLGVTALYTAELQDLFSTEVGMPMQGISSLIENMLLVRYVEEDDALCRMLSIVKTRDSDYDNTCRELLIGPKGASLGRPLRSERARPR